MGELARQVQHVTGQTVKPAFADQGHTGDTAAQAAGDEGMELQIIKPPEAKKASCCCRVAGWSSAVPDDPTACGGRLATMSACLKLWRAFTSSFLPCSRSSMPCLLSKVPIAFDRHLSAHSIRRTGNTVPRSLIVRSDAPLRLPSCQGHPDGPRRPYHRRHRSNLVGTTGRTLYAEMCNGELLRETIDHR